MIKEVIKADGSIEKFDLDKLSKWASNAVKLATNDVEMMRMIDQHRNQRSFSVCNGVELV